MESSKTNLNNDNVEKPTFPDQTSASASPQASAEPPDSSQKPQPQPQLFCQRHLTAPKNLVVCVDGTSNQFNDKSTNVVELYSRLVKDPNTQLTFYNSGIGTHASPSWKSWSYYKQSIGHKVDLVIAWRFERILLSAYRWLSEMYAPGDRIFLFGFSRGAYQVRALSGMIEKIGLIHKGNEAQIPFAYELYCQSDDENQASELPPSAVPDGLNNAAKSQAVGVSSEPDPKLCTDPPTTGLQNQVKKEDKAARFKRTFCRGDVKIHFVGAWDTVSSVGVNRSDTNLPLTTSGMKHVCYFRHALALDERRVKFLPEFARGGAGPLPSDTSTSEKQMPHTKEVWFSGTHSDIGGGNTENVQLVNNGPALRWMIREAMKAGLMVIPFTGRWSSVKDVKEIHESLTGFWRMLEIIPFKRLTYKNAKEVTHRLHLGRRRKIVEGQLIHRSVYYANYRSLPEPWNTENAQRIEPDTFDRDAARISLLVDDWSKTKTEEEREHLLKEICEHVSNSEGGSVGFNDLLHSLLHPAAQLLHDMDYIRAAIAITGNTNARLRRYPRLNVKEMPPIIYELLRKSDNDPDARTFLRGFAQAAVGMLSYPGDVYSAFSPDSKRLAIAVPSQAMVTIMDAKTAEVQRVLSAEQGSYFRCLAFSSDGKRIALGLSHGAIQIWDAQQGESPAVVLKGHGGTVFSVCFSADDTKVLSSSGDCTIQLWDTREHQPLLSMRGVGHLSTVWTARFSPDGSKIVSCSEDRTIRIWDPLHASEHKLLQGHTHSVASAVFSKDGKQIFSASLDGTIRVWNVETGEQCRVWVAATGKPEVPPPHERVQEPVSWISLSPDGTRIVSGSSSGVIRMWDVAKGEECYDPAFLTPSSFITRITYSPDGKRIAITTTDGRLYLADANGPDGGCVVQEILNNPAWYARPNL